MTSQMSVVILPTEAIEGPEIETDVLVSIRTPKGAIRMPTDVCCVIDVSGSMGVRASVKQGPESDGLSVMDITKHAVMTVIHTLSEVDRISIVVFNHSATTLLPMTRMDKAGQESAKEVVAGIVPGGSTGLWQGLQAGLENVRAEGVADRMAHLMLLTDGESDEGEVKVMQSFHEYCESNERIPCSISTFGFGNSACSPLLSSIASLGSGSFAFIPDAGFVGTVFVNALSNFLCSAARHAQLSLEAGDGCGILRASGGWQLKKSGEFQTIDLGVLQYDQSRDLLLRMKIRPGLKGADSEPYLFATLTYSDLKSEITVQTTGCETSDLHVELASRQQNRCEFVDLLLEILGLLSTERGGGPSDEVLRQCSERLQTLAASMQSSKSSANEETKGLLEDCLGQTALALSKMEFWSQWGKHYVRSLSFAHKLQQCNNFKDPGVQHYGGALFKELQEVADTIFNQLPAPVPANMRRPSMQRAASTSSNFAAPAVVNMASYNDRYAGCIDGSSVVSLASGKSCRVSELMKGDLVLGFDGRVAEVRCVVETLCDTDHVALVEVSANLRLTPYHPILKDGIWCFPAEIAEAGSYSCPHVYNFVLDGAPALLVDGTAVVGLGHGLTEGAAAHPYFATEAVLKDLEKMPGYAYGRVVLKRTWALRDPVTGLVCGMA